MKVQKRNGKFEEVKFDKITERIAPFCKDLIIDPIEISQKIVSRIHNNITTIELDDLTCQLCAGMSLIHPDYQKLASRICINNHQKNTSDKYSTVIINLQKNKDILGNNCPLLSDELVSIVEKNAEVIDNMIDYNRDYNIDFFGFKTLERAYLMHLEDKTILERPQHMWMRVAIGIHGNNLSKVKETYDYLSQGYFTHATPTLFHAGTPRPQMSSCFLHGTSDSVHGIYDTIKRCAVISKWAGGIGVHISNIRAAKSYIRGTNGISNGLMPMLKVYNDTARYIDQCIHPNTYIYTNHGPKLIQECVPEDDKIFNITGKAESIQKVLEHSYNGDVYKVKTMHSIEPLIITGEHPIYILRDQGKCINFNTIRKKLDNKFINFEWADIKNCNVRDMIAYPIPTYEKDIEEITSDDCYMYGIVLGDGNMDRTSNYGKITLHSINKKYILDWIISYFNNKVISYRITVNGNTTKIRWNKTTRLPFLHNEVYDKSNSKYCHYRWLNLPIKKSRMILKGLIDTDGCKHKELVFDTTSRQLLESVRYLILKMGALTSGYIRDRRGETHKIKNRGFITNRKISYCLRIPHTKEICKLFSIKQGSFVKFLTYKNLLLSRIQSVEKEPYSGVLFDLQMTNEHNYMIHHGLVHNGGGRRKGSFAMYLEPWHADVFEFLDARKPHGSDSERARDLFYALWIPDLFMKRVKDNGIWSLMCPDTCKGLSDVYGDEFDKLYCSYEEEGKFVRQIQAQELWKAIIDAQIETGTPYMLYKDACNKKSNQKNIGTIKSSNLCVAPETLILTDKGYFEIQDLKNKKVNVWNGKEFSNVEIKKTGNMTELIKVYLNDGTSLSCTKYHKFYVQIAYFDKRRWGGDIINSNVVQTIEAQNLKSNMKIIRCDFPVIDNEKHLKFAYTHGFASGSTSYIKKEEHAQITLSKKKANLLKYLDVIESKEIIYGSYGKIDRSTIKIIATLPKKLRSKSFVPINYSLKSKLEWLSGLADANGIIVHKKSLQFLHRNKKPCYKIKLLLQTCGVASTITIRNISKTTTKKYHVVQIHSIGIKKLFDLGFSPKRLKIEQYTKYKSAIPFYKIDRIKKTRRFDETYCFNEPKRHAGIFNGVITSQCVEIMEYSDDKEVAVCNLASIALPKFIKKGKTLDNTDIMIYTKSNCNFCKYAKKIIQKYNLNSFQIIPIENEDERKKFYHSLGKEYDTYINTMPQIFRNNILIGGFDDLLDYIRPEFDFQKLYEVTRVVTYNLNEVIDKNFYPLPEASKSNLKHRPMGIGVQGLADVFQIMKLPYDSDDSKKLNKQIFETMYFAALSESLQISKNGKGPYKTFKGSPLSQGIFQFELWDGKTELMGLWNWEKLRTEIMEYGVYNSLFLALMPTASTAQILGNNESFEPYTSNLYTRRTLAGEFTILNKHLMGDLIDFGLWNEELKDKLMYHRGSVQFIPEIPKFLREIYRTSWELSQKQMINMSADRGRFIDQSQSFNVFVKNVNFDILSKIHFYGWSKGLKTGTYYIRSKASVNSQRFTIDPKKEKQYEEEGCLMCSG
ncbi:ribonucleoside-diphosphate reductase subunit alpha [Aureispira]|nr:ribonucleoside-diphosphate reductase subunit alpha [Aureispira sp.]